MGKLFISFVLGCAAIAAIFFLFYRFCKKHDVPNLTFQDKVSGLTPGLKAYLISRKAKSWIKKRRIEGD